MSNWRYNYFETQILLPEVAATIQWEMGSLIKLLKNWFYLHLKLFSKVHTVYCTWLQIRVQHWGDDHHILVTFLILGGMILRFLVWENFFGIPKLMFFYSFPPHFWWRFFCSPAFFPISCSNSLIPKKFPPPCMLRPPKSFPLEPSLKNIGACWAMGKIKIIGGMEVKYWGGMYPPSPRDLQPWYCKHSV